MSTAFILMIISTITKASGFIRELVFSYFLGTSEIKDIYVITTSIPTLLFGFIFNAISSSFIPVYNRVINEQGEKEGEKFTSNVANVVLIIGIALIVIAFIFAEPLVKLFASGWEGDTLTYAVKFTRVTLFSIIATSFFAPFGSYLITKGDFINTSVNGLILNFVVLVTAFIAYYTKNWFILAYGFVIASFLQFIRYVTGLKRVNFHHEKIVNFKDKYINDMVKLSIPVLISIAANRVSNIIDKTIATTLFKSGGVSALDYADKTVSLVDGIVIASVMTVVYPKFIKLLNDKDSSKFKNSVSSSIVSTLLIVMPCTAGIFILAKPTISILFERGAFDANSTLLTSGALRYYSFSLIGLTIYSMLTRAFYSLRDTITPVKMMLVQVSVDIPLNFLLSSIFGLNGLAMSSSIGIIAAGIFGIFAFNKKVGGFNIQHLLSSIFKLSICSIIMAPFTYYSYLLISPKGRLLGFLASIVISIAVYIVLLQFTKLHEVRELQEIFTSKFKKKIKNKQDEN